MQENKRYIVWLPLIIAAVAAIGLLTGYQLAGTGVKWQNQDTKQRTSVQEVMDLLKLKYVDSVAFDSIEANGIQAIIRSLDPHTVYIPAEDLEDVNADLAGGFFGIGVEYLMIDDTMNLVFVMENGPADKAGLRTGDQVIKVNGENVAGVEITTTELRKRIRGSRNSLVELTALRQNSNPLITQVTRANIPLPSIETSLKLSDSIGYIRLNKFSESTYKEFMEASTALQKQGMKQLVLDLRSNGGGILTEATNIADEMIEDGLKLVSTRGEHMKDNTITSTKPGILEQTPIIILIDDYSASASEVLAGALQDHDRATIIGRRSFGKGLVQEQYTLSDGSALRITVARYYTPSGRSIQKPYENGYEDYRREVLRRDSTSDSLLMATQKAYFTDKGKKVYGGGGIMPDIVIETDTARRALLRRQFFAPDLLSRVSFQLFKKYQQQVRGYTTPEAFAKGFSFSADDWKMYETEAIEDSTNTPRIDDVVKPELELRLKANMARYIWRNAGYYTIMRPKDRYLNTAIDFLRGAKAQSL